MPLPARPPGLPPPGSRPSAMPPLRSGPGPGGEAVVDRQGTTSSYRLPGVVIASHREPPPGSDQMVGRLCPLHQQRSVPSGQGRYSLHEGVHRTSRSMGRGDTDHHIPPCARSGQQPAGLVPQPPAEQTGQSGGAGRTRLGVRPVLVAAQQPMHLVADPVGGHRGHRSQRHPQTAHQGRAAEAQPEPRLGGPVADPADAESNRCRFHELALPQKTGDGRYRLSATSVGSTRREGEALLGSAGDRGRLPPVAAIRHCSAPGGAAGRYRWIG